MEQEHRAVLRSKRMLLSQHMDNGRIVEHLFSHNILLESDVAMLERVVTNVKKNEKLLDVLAKRGPQAFHVLVEALRMNKQAYLVGEKYAGKTNGKIFIAC